MGYRLNRLDEPVFIAVSKPLLTEFGIHHRLESCDSFLPIKLDFPAILRKQKNNFEIYKRGKNSAKFLLGLPFLCQFY